ncbi:MAG: ATP-binding protein [Rhodospirillaceae bacterium]
MSDVPRISPIRSAPAAKRYLLSIVIALAGPLIINELWWAVQGLQRARDQTAALALRVAASTSLGIQRELDQIEDLLLAMAGVVSREVFSEGVDPAQPGWCQRRVARIVEVYPFLDNVVLTGPDASVLCSYLELADSLPLAAQPWWDEYRVRPRFRVGELLQRPSTNTWVLPFVAPLTSASGDVGGALVAEIEVVGLFDAIVRTASSVARMNSTGLGLPEGMLPSQYLVTVTSPDQVVIARSDDAENHIGQRLPEFGGVDRVVDPGRAFASGPDFLGVERTWGMVELPSGWWVYVGVPAAQVLGPARREWLTDLALTLSLLVPGLLVAGYGLNALIRWHEETVRRVGHAAEGKTLPITSDTPSELVAIYDQLNASVEARQSEIRALKLRAGLFDTTAVGIYTSTPAGRFLEVNRAFVSMMGYDTPQDLIEAGPAALYADPRVRTEIVREVLTSAVESTGQLGAIQGEIVDWVRADGSSITVRLSGGSVPLAGNDGEETVFQMFAHDVTEERDREERERLAAIGRLAGGIAHDFNNLLTVIRGYLEIIEDAVGGDSPLRKSLSEIAGATERAVSLTGRLLSFSRGPALGAAVSDCNDAVINVRALVARLFPESVTVKTELGEGPYPVAVAAGELEQALLNLLLNARDAMPLGGTICISTEAAPRMTENGDAVAGVNLTVTDDGSGMPPEIRQRMFEPFFTTKSMGVGTGLGLSTVYGLLKRAGGSMGVQSAVGKGTTMDIWLPLTDEPVTVDEPMPEAPMAGIEKVLVVEDDDKVREIVVRALSASGYRVLTAANGRAALEQVRSEAETIHLVLSDVVMPEMGGVALAQELTKISPHTRVLFMTGYIQDPVVAAELERRPDLVLFKPFSGAELCRWVRRVLDQ